MAQIEKAPEGGSFAGMVQAAGKRMLVRRKSLKAILMESERDHSDGSSSLSFFDLLCIGVGGTIGSGVFVLTGKALGKAGPSAIVAWPLAGLVCLFSASSYMELSSRLPTKGSCYAFAYHGLGEVAAVAGTVCLTMEYAVSSAGVARSWAAGVYRLMGSWWVVCYNGAKAPAPGCNADDDYYFDPLGTVLTILCLAVLFKSLDFGKHVIDVFTVGKVMVVIFMIIGGFSCWHVNIFESTATFAPVGAAGILQTTSQLFFGFIGFDEVCCMASRAQNPTRTMPRALIATIIIAAVLSALAQMSLSSMVPFKDGMATSFSAGFKENGLDWAAAITSYAELLLLPLVVLLGYLPQPEITAAMSEDGLLPSILSKKEKRTGIYTQGLMIIGGIFIAVTACVPFAVLWDLISIGVLVGFNLTNASLINVRYGNGGKREERTVDLLVWSLMCSTCVAGFALNLGVVSQLLNGEKANLTYASTGGAALLISILITFALWNHPTKCDMSDPQIFKAIAVPFVPSAAMFLNFFLLSTFPVMHTWYFLLFLGAFLALYVFYVCRRGGKALCDDDDAPGIDNLDLEDTEAGSSTAEETSVEATATSSE